MKTLKDKIEELLSHDTPSNYDCWESAEESIFEELTEEEQEEYQNLDGSIVEEWFAANEETESDEDESEQQTED